MLLNSDSQVYGDEIYNKNLVVIWTSVNLASNNLLFYSTGIFKYGNKEKMAWTFHGCWRKLNQRDKIYIPPSIILSSIDVSEIGMTILDSFYHSAEKDQFEDSK